MYDPIMVDHPRLLTWANRAGRLLARCGLEAMALDAESLLARGARQAGYRYDQPAMTHALHRLVASVREDARPSLFGRLALKRMLERAIASRFRIEKALADAPGILEEPIREPVFIVGMPRSGTTILQALLALDPEHRSPLCWECLLPYPAPTPDSYATNDRIDAVRREFDQLFRLVPDFRKKHYMEADSPQECLGITALNFTSFQYVAQCYLPEYLRWFSETADQIANLRWHRRFLQFLQSGGVRSRRWLLKSPVHLMRLSALFAVYPDARIVVTHRHPASLVPSTASLVSSMRSMYSDHEDPGRTAREQLDVWAGYFERFLADREALGKEEQIVDVLFDDFAADPLTVTERVYERFAWDLRPDTRTRMESFLASQRQGKHGPHEYSLAQFGVESHEIESRYAVYLDFLDRLYARGATRRQ